MKEKPILFSAPMVRALLNGSKTQTRRVMKPQPQMVNSQHIEPWRGDAQALMHLLEKSGKRCPYGQPGDQLWVRETHMNWWKLAADGQRSEFAGVAAFAADGYELQPDEKWIPSIHMLRVASRITLEIVSVRVERLQDISEADAIAEGIDSGAVQSFARVEGVTRPAGFAYRDLWESINGPGSWDANPWVWVVEFKRASS